MWQWAPALLLMVQTQVIDDPFERSVIYFTPLDGAGAKANIAYANAGNCAFLEVSERAFASSRERGSKEAASFFEFKLTALYRGSCGNPLDAVDISQARYFGALEADIDVKPVSASCAGDVCKSEYSVSTRLTSGLSSANDEVVLKFGAPHSPSFLVKFPLKAYLGHRGDALR
jgi:hypothetical protein